MHGWKLTSEQKAEVVARAAEGQTQQRIADHFGVRRSSIGSILSIRRKGGGNGKLAAEQQAEIVDLYAAGETTYSLAARIGVDRETISRTLRRRGAIVRTTSKMTAQQRAEAVRLYLSGENSQQVADRFGVADESIRGAVIRSGAAMRSRGESLRVHAVRHDAFDVLTPDAAYWCGFIFTDGGININRLGVEIAASDRPHLVKLRTFLGAGYPITSRPSRTFRSPGTGKIYTGQPGCALHVLSGQVTERLLSLGRYDGEVSAELTASPHFWRGTADGDGSIGIYQDGRRPHLPGHPSFGLYGQRRLLEAFNVFLEANGMPVRRIRPLTGLFEVKAGCAPAARIIEALYRDAPTVLDRKGVIAAAVLALPPRPPARRKGSLRTLAG